jgi:hypothetical protein
MSTLGLCKQDGTGPALNYSAATELMSDECAFWCVVHAILKDLVEVWVAPGLAVVRAAFLLTTLECVASEGVPMAGVLPGSEVSVVWARVREACASVVVPFPSLLTVPNATLSAIPYPGRPCKHPRPSRVTTPTACTTTAACPASWRLASFSL